MKIASEVLSDWNRLDEESAIAAILPCCGSTEWARELVQARPIPIEAVLLERSDAIWRSLSRADWDEAFRSHPKIGENKAEKATDQSAEWSRGEQSGVIDSVAETRAALEQGNRSYEERFGRIFIICATGRSAEDILANLERRLENDAETELIEAVEQQRQITHLRLKKWLDL